MSCRDRIVSGKQFYAKTPETGIVLTEERPGSWWYHCIKCGRRVSTVPQAGGVEGRRSKKNFGSIKNDALVWIRHEGPDDQAALQLQEAELLHRVD